MKQRLEVELDVITELSPLELASKITLLVQETIDTVKESLGTELAFDISLCSTVARFASSWSRYNLFTYIGFFLFFVLYYSNQFWVAPPRNGIPFRFLLPFPPW